MATKYLTFFPKPLLDDLINGRWLPVVGAGLSLNAKTPRGKKMPLWSDLAKAIESDLEDFSSNSAIDSLSAFEHEFGRPRLIERLTEILLLREATPSDVHENFCSIPFEIVCTTNFDFLLERQYEMLPRYVYPVVDEEQLSLHVARDSTLLLKIHGDVRHPSRMVVTESDYDSFLSKYPMIATYLANLLITKTAVFIGYSLDDPDFRQVWQIVAQRLGRSRRQAYAIAVGAKPADVARFARRGVTVINLPGSQERYGEVLARAFKELADYWRKNIISVSTVTEEESLRELLLPEDSSTRLCFFSIPRHRIAFYKERVFPAVEGIGLVPITAEDVISPGDSYSAKIEALMNRSAAIVVEADASWTSKDMKRALSQIQSLRDPRGNERDARMILVLATKDIQFTNLPILGDGPFTIIDVDWDTYIDDSIQRLTSILRQNVPQSGWLILEADRLYQAREYRAAVIAAISYLEVSLRERLDKPSWIEARRPMSLRDLTRIAVQSSLINENDIRRIDKWIELRNHAVHSNTPVSRNEANEICFGVRQILNKA